MEGAKASTAIGWTGLPGIIRARHARVFNLQTPRVNSVISMYSFVSFCAHETNHFNSLRPRPNRRYFAGDIFKCIFENENEWISPRISLKFVPKVRINIMPALVQIMAWRRPGDKPLSELMMVDLLTHICVTRPQWVNALRTEPNSQHFTGDIFM